MSGKAGRSLKPIHVLLVGTHSDCVCVGDNSAESTAAVLLETVSQKFDDVVFGAKMFTVNALEAMSSDMKALRGAVADWKSKICQVNHSSTEEHSKFNPHLIFNFLELCVCVKMFQFCCF